MKCFNKFLVVVGISALALLGGCEKSDFRAQSGCTIYLDLGQPATKSSDIPDEDKISDLNIFVFNGSGELEDRYFFRKGDISLEGGLYSCRIKLLKGAQYDVYVLANLGYKPAIGTLEDLMSFRYYLSRPDDYSFGVPMSGFKKGIDGDKVEVELVRAVSKVSLRLDRSHLSSDISYNISSVLVGNCPRSITLFGKGAVESEDELFPVGFSSDRLPCEVFLLENMGSGDNSSYIEVRADYDSPTKYSKPGEHLIYRFYIVEDKERNVERNCHYQVTIIPENDGLGDGNTPEWRIDRSSLSTRYNGTPKLVQHPSDYIECHIGDTLHLWCDVYPPDTPFTIDPSNIENDTGLGLYEYDLDPDGFGITLYMKKRGTSHIYMEAGAPIDDAALYVIVCEP